MPESSLLLYYQYLICTVTCASLAMCAWNLLRMPRLGASRLASASQVTPSVSVLVPARNEERCIEACVRSLCTQTYASIEVIVLDDGSTDRTPEILRSLQQEFPRLQVLHGSPLPKGWVGKSWACDQLYRKATGDVLLFTDADTVHKPGCIEASVQFMLASRVDFFSVIPYEVLGSFGEHVVIPMVHLMFLSYLPNGIVHPKRRFVVAAANGQFMWFTREGYVRSGGHAGVHDSLVEDLFLAKNAQRAGLRMMLIDGSHHVACRMYENARQVTEGFSKNFFPATRYSIPMTALILVHVLTAYVVPAILWIDGQYLLSIIPLVAAALMRTLIAIRFRMPLWHMVLQPITALWTVVIGLNSVRWVYSKQGVRWKGRSYE